MPAAMSTVGGTLGQHPDLCPSRSRGAAPAFAVGEHPWLATATAARRGTGPHLQRHRGQPHSQGPISGRCPVSGTDTHETGLVVGGAAGAISRCLLTPGATGCQSPKLQRPRQCFRTPAGRHESVAAELLKQPLRHPRREHVRDAGPVRVEDDPAAIGAEVRVRVRVLRR